MALKSRKGDDETNAVAANFKGGHRSGLLRVRSRACAWLASVANIGRGEASVVGTVGGAAGGLSLDPPLLALCALTLFSPFLYREKKKGEGNVCWRMPVAETSR